MQKRGKRPRGPRSMQNGFKPFDNWRDILGELSIMLSFLVSCPWLACHRTHLRYGQVRRQTRTGRHSASQQLTFLLLLLALQLTRFRSIRTTMRRTSSQQKPACRHAEDLKRTPSSVAKYRSAGRLTETESLGSAESRPVMVARTAFPWHWEYDDCHRGQWVRNVGRAHPAERAAGGDRQACSHAAACH